MPFSCEVPPPRPHHPPRRLAADLGLVLKVDIAELQAPALMLSFVLFMICLGTIVISIVFLAYITKRMLDSIERAWEDGKVPPPPPGLLRRRLPPTVRGAGTAHRCGPGPAVAVVRGPVLGWVLHWSVHTSLSPPQGGAGNMGTGRAWSTGSVAQRGNGRTAYGCRRAGRTHTATHARACAHTRDSPTAGGGSPGRPTQVDGFLAFCDGGINGAVRGGLRWERGAGTQNNDGSVGSTAAHQAVLKATKLQVPQLPAAKRVDMGAMARQEGDTAERTRCQRVMERIDVARGRGR